MSGYMGRILRVDLTTGAISTIDTRKYEQWGGGHGIGSAIFWDLCKDKTIDGFDPANVVTIMTSPLSGTLAPAAAGRTEIQGIGVQSYPIGWFTRSNFGGRFSGMLKYAGWDGIVIQGKANAPVWLDIRDGDVRVRDATTLWGRDTYETQEEIWRIVGRTDDEWAPLSGKRDGGRTTQRPAVLAVGPAGETRSRIAALVHDAGNGAGQGGFGAVFGAKNLKAISVVGTGSVPIADPKALMAARLWSDQYKYRIESPSSAVGNFSFPAAPGTASSYPPNMGSRPQGCLGCHRNCRGRTATGRGNESHCIDLVWYSTYDAAKHGGKPTNAVLEAADLMQRAGVNAFELEAAMVWLSHLHKQGLIGRGKRIDTDLPFDQVGETAFAEALIRKIARREEIGADLSEGLARAAKKWGRLDEDLRTGILPLQEWGYAQHYDARTEVEWGYGSLLGDRDINEHDFNWVVYWTPTINVLSKTDPPVTAEQLASIVAKVCAPYNDPKMVDYSDEGIYSESMAKLVAWHRHYTRFWKQSIGYCDWAYADLVNPYGPDNVGLSGEAEPKFFNAVTGKNISFADGIEVGRKIWDLDRAIWVLQGRTRDMEVFADYNYETPAQPGFTNYELPYVMPVYEGGQWTYKNVAGRKLDRQRVEEWKTKFYTLEGWDTKTGSPTRQTLEGLGLGHVADELARSGKLAA